MNLLSTSTPNSKRSGFTLIEIIIVIALIGILASMGLWVSMDFYRSYSFRSEKNIFISALQKARMESMLNINEDVHGVHVESGRYVIFQGTPYVEGGSLNQAITPSGGVKITGNPVLPQDVVFNQLSASTSYLGTFTIGDGVRSSTISINNNGQISW
ncbi:MAG: prepilin-type N-terminal cleavage/methylation domain-containing protein [Patescibacteria group bacterium]|nr:prepilin-type N-terminal cleavage/methylation domain-containing protein [Patescibacteria group bacterium]MDE2015517.1 prepilin-type N-terminal cleavage/methylation domain-containing protein [Patescibacteria group bacterium]MDE2226867.1 prepilin-type N-terminal cleavage/methylation domain-containing protein [Patescibacteria group bacterium]